MWINLFELILNVLCDWKNESCGCVGWLVCLSWSMIFKLRILYGFILVVEIVMWEVVFDFFLYLYEVYVSGWVNRVEWGDCFVKVNWCNLN